MRRLTPLAGNLYDRVTRAPGFGRGAVLDWIDLRRWPLFNLATPFCVSAFAAAIWLSWRNIPLPARTRPAQDKPA